jgi:hypothetical protein
LRGFTYKEYVIYRAPMDCYDHGVRPLVEIRLLRPRSIVNCVAGIALDEKTDMLQQLLGDVLGSNRDCHGSACALSSGNSVELCHGDGKIMQAVGRE